MVAKDMAKHLEQNCQDSTKPVQSAQERLSKLRLNAVERTPLLRPTTQRRLAVPGSLGRPSQRKQQHETDQARAGLESCRFCSTLLPPSIITMHEQRCRQLHSNRSTTTPSRLGGNRRRPNQPTGSNQLPPIDQPRQLHLLGSRPSKTFTSRSQRNLPDRQRRQTRQDRTVIPKRSRASSRNTDAQGLSFGPRTVGALAFHGH